MNHKVHSMMGVQETMNFDRIYDAHVDAIYRYANQCVRNPADAEDLTAQTFYKALKNFWRFRLVGVPISAWLYRIATNEINSYFRLLAKTKMTRLVTEDSATSPPNQLEPRKLRVEIMQSLDDCLASLRPKDRTLIVLRFFEKKTYAEIALVTGKRISALKMRVHRALKQLQSDLEKRGVDDAFYRATFAQPC